ncbi:DUF3566 domain-containing protein [Candidatus Woesearchaeota archaeon]|nr:DUF3566 domain-containing protein [Candidatus Woesearchaeota archaeon]
MKTLEKMGILSLAKIQGLIGLILGLLYGIIIFTVEKIDPNAFSQDLSTEKITPIGSLALVFGPVVGLIYGFLGGIIIASLYNTLAKLVGGIQLEFKEK